MYKVIGADGKEYGPVSPELMREWLTEGRLNADSNVRLYEQPGDWMALRDLPEFADVAAVAPPPPAYGTTAAAQPAKVSGLAITSLVLGILGLFTAGLTALFGLVAGIVALVKINRSQGRLGGNGMAIAGTAVSGVMVLLLPLLLGIMVPAFAKARSKAQGIQCMNSVKQINLALILYAGDHNDQLPAGDSWCDVLAPYLGGSTKALRCAAQPEGDRCSYTLNAAVAGKRVSDFKQPHRVLLVFSSDAGWNQVGERDSAKAHKHGTLITAGFLDGHAEAMTRSRFEQEFQAARPE